MAGIWGDGQRGGIFGARIDPRLQAELERRAQQRIAGAFEASQGMQEPSRALYEAKHRRAQEGQPVEPGFWEDVASLGARAVGGAQKMWQAAPMAAEALWNDPLGSINRAGLAGQAATDAIVQGAVRPFTQFGDPNVDPAQQGADLALTAMGGSAAVPAETNALRMGIRAEPLASKSHLIYDPPMKPPRNFEEDYKGGARVDEAGNLTHDIEGNPLTARFVAGRRRAGEPDIGLSPADIQAVSEEGFGARVSAVPGSRIGGDAGRLVMGRVPETGAQDWRINLNSSLTPERAERVTAHEVSHLIDELAGRISTTGLSRELRPVYNTLNTGRERAKHLMGPEPRYRGEDVDLELMAEAIRAYMRDPNYLKKMAPKTAEAIRAAVNTNPELAQIIQFNVGGIPLPLIGGEPEEAQAAQKQKGR